LGLLSSVGEGTAGIVGSRTHRGIAGKSCGLRLIRRPPFESPHVAPGSAPRSWRGAEVWRVEAAGSQHDDFAVAQAAESRFVSTGLGHLSRNIALTGLRRSASCREILLVGRFTIIPLCTSHIHH
jgi:hypothetical protein